MTLLIPLLSIVRSSRSSLVIVSTSVPDNRDLSDSSIASARQAIEPVFSISDKFPWQSFGSVFRTGLDDPAITNALMLSLLLAANGGRVDAEFLSCKSLAIHHINQKLAAPLESSIDATIGAILLIIGVESRLGVRSHIQIHLQGVLELLKFCNTRQIYLCDGIKRAIFWQDLNAALTTGIERILNHDIFPELHWGRDPIFSSFYSLPLGFEPFTHMFTDELIEALEDVHALQQLRTLSEFNPPDAIAIRHLDNQQAWIESRLYQCYRASDQTDHVVISVILAAYLCTYSLFSEVWTGQWIPSHCSSQLLRSIQHTGHGDYWKGNEELLVWLLMAGGAFAQPGLARSEYAVILHRNYHDGLAHLLSSWDDIEGLLKTFIWSEALFSARGREFWEACCIG